MINGRQCCNVQSTLSAVDANVNAFSQPQTQNNDIRHFGERNKENRPRPCRMTNETDNCLISRLSNVVQTANFFVHRNCKVIFDVQVTVHRDKFL